MKGVSLASEVSYLIQDIATYCNEGYVIAAFDPIESAAGDLVDWVALRK